MNPDKLKPKNIVKSYAGFIVLKPLPETIFGRTCLETYPLNNTRFYPVTRKYKTNLFGMDLEVTSLAFQEQDTSVAACATSALWSVFQSTGFLFHHAIPSPVEITKSATDSLPSNTRIFPNHGLSVEQMAHAIRAVGLEPYLVNINNDNDGLFLLKTTLYAYMKCGIPVIMGGKLYDGSEFMGMHAIAVSGYNTDSQAGKTGEFKALNINKIYAHDDQTGPFSRMEINTLSNGTFYLTTCWNGKGQVTFIPTILQIPLYNKIRVPFFNIQKIINDFNSIIHTTFENNGVNIVFTWDINLSFLNEFKSDIYENYDNPEVRKILFEPLPRFLWRCVAFVDSVPWLELLFDATNIERGHSFLYAIPHHSQLYDFIKSISKDIDANHISTQIFQKL